MLIIDCINSTAYSFFTNPVYVSRTSNHLGTISLFSRNFHGKPRKVTRKQTRRSSMILGFSYINSQFIFLLSYHLAEISSSFCGFLKQISKIFTSDYFLRSLRFSNYAVLRSIFPFEVGTGTIRIRETKFRTST